MESIRKILIVDDDTLFLNLLAQALRERGHIVTTASGVQEARNAFLADDFSLVCSDIRMADGTGFELLDYIRTSFTKLPAIIMSSYLTREDRFEARIAKAFWVEKTDKNLVDIIVNYEE